MTAIGKDSEEEYLQPHVNVGTANQQEEELVSRNLGINEARIVTRTLLLFSRLRSSRAAIIESRTHAPVEPLSYCLQKEGIRANSVFPLGTKYVIYFRGTYTCFLSGFPLFQEKSDVYADSNPLVGDALVDRIAMLFHGADSDGNGTLSRMEFQEASRHHVDPSAVQKIVM